MLDRVRDLLAGEGYRELPQPLVVAGEAFQFDAVFVGPKDHGNLVVLVLGSAGPSCAATRRVRTLIWLLERTGSSRPVTVVVVGPRGQDPTVGGVGEFAHTITIPDDADGKDAARFLKPLTRLNLPNTVTPDSVAGLLSDALGRRASDPRVGSLLAAAQRGPDEVKATLLRLVDQATEMAILEVGHD